MEELQKLLIEKIKDNLKGSTLSPTILDALNRLLGTVSGILLTKKDVPPLP